MDRDGNGVLEVKDLLGRYNGKMHPKVQSGEWTEEQALRHFLDTFDSLHNKDGRVTLEEWEQYYSDLSANIDTDDYFALMMERVWGLEEEGQETGAGPQQ